MSENPAEQNKASAIRLMIEAYDNHNLDVADELLAEEVVFHNAGTEIHGIEGWKTFTNEWITGFADADLSVDFAMAEDDRVLLHWRAVGTHTGVFRGTQATGRHVSASGFTLLRFAVGKVVEIWDETEAFGDLEGLSVS